jgi:hypothetical protein
MTALTLRGSPPRVHSGLLPREDHASKLVGLVRDITGLLGGWRRPFRAVRQIGQKWATCTPGMLYKVSWTPQSRGARSARTSSQQRVRAIDDFIIYRCARRARRRGLGGGVTVVSLGAYKPHKHNPHHPCCESSLVAFTVRVL